MQLRTGLGMRSIATMALLIVVMLSGRSFGQQQFSHAQHVDNRWLTVVENEVWRDCNGCHQLETEGSGKRDWAPGIGAVCAQCHQTGVAPSFLNLSPPTPKDPERKLYFYHGDHAWGTPYTVNGKTRKLDCRSCHVPEGSKVPDLIPRPEPTRDFCLKCHSDGNGKQFHVDFINNVNHGVDRSDPEAKKFNHRRIEHKQGKDNAGCNFCHTGMRDAAAGDFAEFMLDVNACMACHADDGMKVTTSNYTKPSITRNTFIHERHLQPVAIEQHPELKDCQFCHVDDKRGGFTLKPEFTEKTKPGEKGPPGCRGCHEEWAPPNHGQVGTCLLCHDLENGDMVSWRDLSAKRGTLQTRRPRSSQFVTTTHQHSFLGENPKEECQSCHVAALPEQPSRFQGRKFEHWPHLSDNPTKEECVVCHGNAVARSTNLKYLASSHEGEIPLNYDKQVCATCHPGRDPKPDFANARPREVTNFNHSRHAKFDCTECHEPPAGPGDGGELGLPTLVGNCTKCHGHRDPDKIANSYNITMDNIDGCKNCHVEGLPVPGREVHGRRKHISQLTGSPGRTHSPTDPCEQCHVGRKRRDQRMASNKDIENPHKTIGIPQAKVPEGLMCIDCHWGKSSLPMRRMTGWKLEPYGKLGLEYQIRDAFGGQETIGREDHPVSKEKKPFPGMRIKR